MEDISSLIWLGIAILWFVTRIIRRGARKIASSRDRSASPAARQPAAPPGQTAPTRIGQPPADFGRDSTGPRPIVPR